MKKIIYATLALGALVATASCKKEEAFVPSQKLTITVNDDLFTDEEGSKVTLNGMKFAWEATDQVGVVGTDKYNVNLEPLTNDGNCQTFSGTISSKIASENEYWVVYPYANQVFRKKETDKRITEIPSSPYQTAVKGGLPLMTYNLTAGMAGKPAIVLIGKTTDNGTKATLSCQNALLKFKFKGSDIKEVHFTMSSPNLAADRMYYCTESYTSGSTTREPGYFYPQDGCCETQTIVVRPESGCFEAGEYYYAAIAPAEYKLAFRAFRTSDNKNCSKTQKANSKYEAGKIYTIGDNKGLDEIASFADPTAVEGNAITFDFTDGKVTQKSTTDTPIPSELKKGSADYFVNGLNTSWTMTIKDDNGFMLENVSGTNYLLFKSGKHPYFSAPPITGYTIMSADIEFEQAYENVYVYWGKGSAPASNSSMNGEKILLGSTKKATVYTQMCTSYCRYYLLISSGDGRGGFTNLDKDVRIKSVTFHYSYGSWHGSWE